VSERFRPLPHVPPESGWRRLLFSARVLIDFQVNTVYSDVMRFSRSASGTIVDIGAGAGPYRHVLEGAGLRYEAIDIDGADRFGYNNPGATSFDGYRIPLDSNSMGGFICTEVLEHVESPALLVAEMHRILKPGGRGLVTIPWSARYHYKPHDFQRLTPTSLQRLFESFSTTSVRPRGTDITVIAAKSIVVGARFAFPTPRRRGLSLPIAVLLVAPVFAMSLALGHLSLALGLGSDDDPLGYTVWLRK
jgi:SAM-dependent methyltransferase